ncbi:hypothetical protein OU426_03900 [Frigidibacter sp. RF13]|uniref:hypothetical protein n=1 Tax=Frigidibacter sp. RF13 TaxID=2997340 RepID=UPI00226E6FC9|nr:hypothetical protein [Frigidibacter sp. RF13]MCY1125989.1 hypothetical protein [Frigidibacter sp. RF13]
MNFSNEALVSRSTIASGRALLSLCGAKLLIHYLDVDLAGLNLLGVGITEEQASAASLWIILTLWIGLLVNWLCDLTSLGRWNAAMTEKGVETMFPGGGRIKGRLVFVAEELEELLEDNRKGSPTDTGQLASIAAELRRLEKSRWIFSKVAWLYVVGWSFAVPTLCAIWAAFLVSCRT